MESTIIEYRRGLVVIPVALYRTNGGEVFRIFVSVSGAIFAIEMTKFEVNGNLIALQQDRIQLFSKNDAITK